MGREVLFSRVYLEDVAAANAWSSVASIIPNRRPAFPDTAGHRLRLNIEQLVAQVEPGTQYSVQTVVSELQPDGSELAHDETMHFKRLLEIATGHSRRHILHMAEVAGDVRRVAPLAFNVVQESLVPAWHGSRGGS